MGATEKTAVDEAARLSEHGVISVSTNALYRLAPLLADREESFWHGGPRSQLWGWRIEPCAAGGVLVIATSGTVIGVIHDPEGRASKPATILASKGLRKAVAPPKKRTVYFPGDHDKVDLPDEFQPCRLMATTLFASVHSISDCAPPAEGDAPVADEGEERYALYTEYAEEGSAWAGGYRLHADYADWRRVFANWTVGSTTLCHQRLSPKLYSAFRRIGRGVLEIAMPEDQAAPVLVQSSDHPEFVGAIMRGDMNRQSPPPPSIPTWLAA